MILYQSHQREGDNKEKHLWTQRQIECVICIFMKSSEYHLLIAFVGFGCNNESLNPEHNRKWNCPELNVKFRKSLIEKNTSVFPLCTPMKTGKQTLVNSLIIEIIKTEETIRISLLYCNLIGLIQRNKPVVC